MNNLRFILVATALCAVPTLASAQCPTGQGYDESTGGCELSVFDRERGELSPHTQAPTAESLEQMLRTRTAPSTLASMLEYGERVECLACIPLLEARLVEDDDATVRELAAWWLRRRPLGFGAIMHDMRGILETDADPVRRARAAAAIGEFMDPHGVAHLGTAIMTDRDATVRAAAVRGIARINSPAGLTFLSAALGDSDASVQEAALSVVLRVNFFSDQSALMPLLAHSDGHLRRRAASVVGALRIADAVPVLAAMLRGDTDRSARQAAAWALGRIGTGDARAALSEVRATEHESLVLDAIVSALN
jgi:HEAT repeat protein